MADFEDDFEYQIQSAGLKESDDWFNRKRRSSPSLPMLTIRRVGFAQTRIDNGGLRYFFEMQLPEAPTYFEFADAYRAIGASRAADHLYQAAALFPFPDPHLDWHRRHDFIYPEDRAAYDEINAKLGAFERPFFDDDIWQCVTRYLISNADHFRLVRKVLLKRH